MLDEVISGYERSVDEVSRSVIGGVIVGVGVGLVLGDNSGVGDAADSAYGITFEIDDKFKLGSYD